MSLGKLTVNGREDGFLCDGKPFFWFADTCWSAFTSIAEDDWDYYLTRRAEQGMNALIAEAMRLGLARPLPQRQ